jgi:predicted amidophosphoribosyltransferase
MKRQRFCSTCQAEITDLSPRSVRCAPCQDAYKSVRHPEQKKARWNTDAEYRERMRASMRERYHRLKFRASK